MRCPRCGSWDIGVIDTDRFETAIKRVRKCRNKQCRHTWNTFENDEKPEDRILHCRAPRIEIGREDGNS